jgi:predicted DNA-binding protein (UPF0251 family)
LSERISQRRSRSVRRIVQLHKVRVSCTRAMLTSLDRERRIADILGDVFELSSDEAAEVCGVSPETYRKRLSRARGRVRDFVSVHCGRLSSTAACRCDRRLEVAVGLGRVDPAAISAATVASGIEEMEHLYDVAGLMRAEPAATAPAGVTERLLSLIDSGRFDLLH